MYPLNLCIYIRGPESVCIQNRVFDKLFIFQGLTFEIREVFMV